MFDGKLKEEMQQFKEEVTNQLISMSSNFNQRMQDQDNAFSSLKLMLSEVKENNTTIADRMVKDLAEISSIKTDFEGALNKLNSISRNVELTAANSVREVVEKELESIKASTKKFRDTENDLLEIKNNLYNINIEISKFLNISQQIKLVDFSLEKHQEDIRTYEKERSVLIDQNERLKTILAKMKRRR